MGDQIKMSATDSSAGCQAVCRNTPGCFAATYNDFFRGKNVACMRLPQRHRHHARAHLDADDPRRVRNWVRSKGQTPRLDGHDMTEAQLRELLSEETLTWAERSPADIVAELAKPQTYRRGEGANWHEIEATLLEATDDYIHVQTSIHDGGLVWALTPITSSFLIYRDGRIEI